MTDGMIDGRDAQELMQATSLEAAQARLRRLGVTKFSHPYDGRKFLVREDELRAALKPRSDAYRPRVRGIGATSKGHATA